MPNASSASSTTSEPTDSTALKINMDRSAIHYTALELAKLIDFETTLPRAVEDLMHQREKQQNA